MIPMEQGLLCWQRLKWKNERVTTGGIRMERILIQGSLVLWEMALLLIQKQFKQPLMRLG